MWVRLGSFRVRAGQGDALRITYNTRAVPKVRAFPGNLGCLLLEPATPDDEQFVACTLWASRGDADAYESSGAAQEVVGLVREFFAEAPTLRSYESLTIGGL